MTGSKGQRPAVERNGNEGGLRLVDEHYRFTLERAADVVFAPVKRAFTRHPFAALVANWSNAMNGAIRGGSEAVAFYYRQIAVTFEGFFSGHGWMGCRADRSYQRCLTEVVLAVCAATAEPLALRRQR
jgi:hypothetical protein